MEAEFSKLLSELKTSKIPSGEKHKKLNELVKAIGRQKLDPSTVIASIQPLDFWSKKARLDIAEQFRVSNIIIEALESDEKIHINRIVTFDWLFKDDSILSDPEFLTEKLFPKISCICRQKIIRKLSNHLEDERKCENIFVAVEEKYGVENAQFLLPSCGSEFISNILTTRKLQLTNRQLTIILNKFPKIATSYLETFYDSKQMKEPALAWTSYHTSTDVYNATLTILAAEDCSEFMKIYEQFHELISGLGLSLRAANRLLRFDVKRIIESPKVYSNLLNKEFLQKKLTSDQFETFFSGIFPDTINHFRRNINDIILWLSKFSPSRKGELLKLGFEKAYSQKLIDRIDCIPSDIVQYLRPEERMKIVDHKLTYDTSDESENIDYYESSPKHYESFWTAFRTIDISIPHIKELIQTESDSSLRSELIVQLVRTCSINEDKIALAEVCKYVVQRHRNENVQVHVDFLEAVDQNFELLELNNSHWDSLREVLQLCLLAGDLTRYSFILNDILEKAFIYFLKNNLPLKSILPSLIQMKTDITWGSNWRMETLKKPEYKSFLTSFLKLAAQEIESKYTSNEDSYHDPKKRKSILALANCFQDWNKTCCSLQEKLTFKNFPWLLEKLVEMLDSDDIFDVTSACQLLLADPVLEKRTYMDDILKINPTERIVLYFFKKEPKKIEENINQLLKFILKNRIKLYTTFLRSVKCYGPTTLSSQMIAVCKKTSEDSSVISQERGNSVIVLSFLLSSSEFFAFIPQFYPTGTKIEVEDDDSEANLQLVTASLASLKNVENPSSGFPTLDKLCTGDYLKYSLGSLYSLCLNSSVEKAVPFLNQLVDRPVSVKKHAIRLLCFLSKSDQVSVFMLKLWKTEQNATIKQEILKQTFKILSNSSSTNSVWNFMKSAIQSLTPAAKDKGCFAEISKQENIENVPTGILPEYFTVCKELFYQDKIDKTLKICLLQAMARNKNRLGVDFFKNVIKNDLFSTDQETQVQQQFILLTISYLLSSPSEVQKDLLDIIVKNFSKLVGTNFTTIYFGPTNTKINTRKLFSYFVENLCTMSFDEVFSGEKYRSLFEQLEKSEFFNQYKTETFGEFLFIKFSSIFHSSEENEASLENAGASIADLLETYVTQYGKEMIGLFNKLFQNFLRQCCKTKCSNPEQILQVINGLLRPTSTAVDCTLRKLIAVQLFPTTCPHGNVEETYKSLVNELLQSTEPVVHMYAYSCLKL